MATDRVRRSTRIDMPMDRSRSLRPNVDTERFGALSEAVARRIGSWAFIMWMTIAIIIWVLINVLVPEGSRPDGYPFIFLVLLLSLQASYAAPLILLAQNRQTDRDRIQFQEDRLRTERLLADSDYLAREIAALRLALGEVATRDYVRGELRDLLESLEDKVEGQAKAQRKTEKKADRKAERKAGDASETDSDDD